MDDLCELWKGYIAKDGYGRTVHLLKSWLAHRLIYTRANGGNP
jgi:hypothetical protein